MKKLFLILFTAILLCGCLLTGSQDKTPNDQKQAVNEQTQPAKPTTTKILSPVNTPTIKKSPTDEPQNTHLESVQIGGIFYTAITLVYDPNTWNIGENEFDKTLELVSDPACKIYENIPRGLPGNQSLEVQTIEEKMGAYSLSLSKWTTKGEIYYAIFNFYDQNISIAVEPWNNDPAACFNAAWSVIENSAENAFGPME